MVEMHRADGKGRRIICRQYAWNGVQMCLSKRGKPAHDGCIEGFKVRVLRDITNAILPRIRNCSGEKLGKRCVACLSAAVTAFGTVAFRQFFESDLPFCRKPGRTASAKVDKALRNTGGTHYVTKASTVMRLRRDNADRSQVGNGSCRQFLLIRCHCFLIPSAIWLWDLAI